jgi:hypothetical protein
MKGYCECEVQPVNKKSIFHLGSVASIQHTENTLSQSRFEKPNGNKKGRSERPF